jgi:hypothetical protein
LLAAGAILGGVVVVAMGRGGEMALFDRDLPLKITRLETPGEVATMALPFGLLGYQARATGHALVEVANLLARRDAEIVALRRELWRLGGSEPMVVPDAYAPYAPGFVAQDLSGASDLSGAQDLSGASDLSGAPELNDEGFDDPGEEASVRDEQASRDSQASHE